MNKEKVILSFVAVTVGLVVAGLAFYFYQQTKVIPPENQKTVTIANPNPSPKPKVILAVNEPSDETVSQTKVIKVSGKTDPSALIVILTDSDENVISPSKTGDFSTTITLNNMENSIQITAIAPNGDTNTVERTVTYSTESF